MLGLVGREDEIRAAVFAEVQVVARSRLAHPRGELEMTAAADAVAHLGDRFHAIHDETVEMREHGRRDRGAQLGGASLSLSGHVVRLAFDLVEFLKERDAGIHREKEKEKAAR